MVGSNKLNDFDDDVQTIKENLKFREVTGEMKELSSTHEDYAKQKVQQG